MGQKWKAIKRSPAFQRSKTFLKRVAGRELWLRPELRLSTEVYGDWAVCPDLVSRDGTVYSIGVGEDIAFDLALIDRFGVEVHGFDPTPNSADWLAAQTLPERFIFHPWALAAHDGTLSLSPRIKRHGKRSRAMYTVVDEAGSAADAIRAPAFTLDTLLQKLGHSSVNLLKMDVEGAEYDVLEALIASAIRPTQLLVEFHHRFPGIGQSATVAVIGALRRTGYRIFAVSLTGREVSFVHAPQANPA